jgi:ABC-type dipeptide/oligopeptide/nickel transport system permease component
VARQGPRLRLAPRALLPRPRPRPYHAVARLDQARMAPRLRRRRLRLLPAITLGGALAAILTRMVRTAMLEELGQDYIRTARAKGLPERTVVYKHALRNAIIPVLTLVGLQFGALLAGAIVTETIFSWPGIGRLTVSAISNRDYALVQGCILAVGLTYVLVNLLTDILYTVANPRIRA